MAKLPAVSSVPFMNPVKMGIRFKTLFSQFDELGEEKRRQKWLYPKRDLTLQYESLTKSEGRTLWAFYIARKGTFEAFNFFDPFSNTYTGEYIGTGDGSTTIFNLPCSGSSGRTVYVNGVSQTEGTDYTFSAGGGDDGADKITFAVAPADGERVTIDFTGNLKVRCRFAEDLFEFETFYDKIVNSGIKMKGLLNA